MFEESLTRPVESTESLVCRIGLVFDFFTVTSSRAVALVAVNPASVQERDRDGSAFSR